MLLRKLLPFPDNGSYPAPDHRAALPRSKAAGSEAHTDMQALDGSMAAKRQSRGNGTSRGCWQTIILEIHFFRAKAVKPVRIGA
jgi:hypothetical protein